MIQEVLSRKDLSGRLPDAFSKFELRSYCRRLVGVLGDSGHRWAVIICPGGGYQMVGPTEGEPVALEFLRAGIQAFVLRYSVAPDEHPQQLLELAASVAYVRSNAARYGIDRVAVCGFSAGGHLAGMLANLWHLPIIAETLGGRAEDYRPDAAILGYPVISLEEDGGCPGCVAYMTGGELPEELSLEKSVTAQNPPAFVWCTVSDPMVPVVNTLRYVQALREKSIPFEAHLFQNGPHAMACATEDSAFEASGQSAHVAHWLELCTEWLKGEVGK